jgi:nucleoid-associated protein YgaU
MYSKRLCLSGLTVMGVFIAGVASGDHHEQPEGSERGTPDQIHEEMADPAPGADVQPMPDPHEREIGNEERPGRAEGQMQDDDPRQADRTRELPPVGAAAGATSSYTVQSGDTLASISERLLGSGDRWKEIAKANDIEDPNKLEVGTRLTIPDRGNAENRNDDDQMEQNQKTPDREEPMDRPGEGTDMTPSGDRAVPPI